MPDPTPTTQTLPPIANVADLQERVGELDAEQTANAESLLRYASNRVRAYGNRRWDNTDGHEIPEELVEVVVGMVERAKDNPTGATQDTTGPFTVSWGPNAAQRVYLTAQDKSIVRSVGSSGAFTVPQGDSQAGGLLGGGGLPLSEL